MAWEKSLRTAEVCCREGGVRHWGNGRLVGKKAHRKEIFESPLRGVQRGETASGSAPFLFKDLVLLSARKSAFGSDWARLGLSTTTFQNEVTVAKGLWHEGEGEGGVAPRGCPWESAEDPLLGKGRLGVLWWEGPLLGPGSGEERKS